MNDALTRYHEFLDQLEAYPNWKLKVMEEVGKWFHLIHNNLEEGDIKRNLFSKLVLESSIRTARSISSESSCIIT